MTDSQQPKETSKGRHILVLVDGSPQADTAFSTALKWKAPEDELHIVHAIDTIPIATSFVYGGHPGEAVTHDDPAVYAAAREALNKRGKALAEGYARICRERKVPHVTTAVLSGQDPKEAVLSYAKDKKVHTIFVGTRGLGMVKRMFMGSFSRYMVEHAECDVMVIKHHDKQAEIPKTQ
eukprot:g45839.t1